MSPIDKLPEAKKSDHTELRTKRRTTLLRKETNMSAFKRLHGE